MKKKDTWISLAIIAGCASTLCLYSLVNSLVKGSIEITYKTTNPDNPTFTYNPKSRFYAEGYRDPGITILAVDNLPTELPKEASIEFSSLIHEYVYQIAEHGKKDITNHAALPKEIRQATIIQDGKFTNDYKYLRKNLI